MEVTQTVAGGDLVNYGLLRSFIHPTFELL